MRRRRGRRDERGAVILLVSLVMTVLLIVTSFVIDLGTTRATKRDAQAIADLAALDAGFFLSGSSPAGLGVAQPRNACIAAIESAQRNVPGFLAGLSRADIEAECAEFPEVIEDCTPLEVVVDENGVEQPFVPWEIELVDGDRTMTIRYPVMADELNAGRFPSGGARDGLDPCERMAVDLRKTTGTTFARIIGVGELSTSAASVVRGTTTVEDRTPPAVLLLDRTNCNVFGNSASGDGNLGIIVENYGETPGLIHADSNATTNCSGSSANWYAIYGTSLSGGAPSIRVFDGDVPADGSPRRLGAIRSAATNGQGAATFPGGLNVAPTVGGVVSRTIVDDKYNSAPTPATPTTPANPGNPAISNLHRDAAARLLRNNVAPPGHTTINNCNNLDTTLQTLRDGGHTELYVSCNPNGSANFSGFTSVEFSGDLTVGNGNTVTFPDATTVTIRGSVGVNGTLTFASVRDLTIGQGLSTGNNGRLAVNSTTADSCAGREGPAWPHTTKMVVFGGASNKAAFDTSGPIAMCQTTLYLGGQTITAEYQVQQTTTGGSCSWKPCPKTTADGNTAVGARFTIGGLVHWSAPNQHPNAVDGATVGLEDLAFWTENGGTSNMATGGQLIGRGVFFGPNASFEMRSPATGAPVDAQFVARRAWLNQGTMRVAPNPANSVMIPMGGDYGLIR